MREHFLPPEPLLNALGATISAGFLIEPSTTVQLNAQLSTKHTTKSGKKVQFVHPEDGLPDLAYETRIGVTGIVETRKNSWHDSLNAWVWLHYPQTKIALNACHLREIEKNKSETRTALRDALTHFDECGVIVLSHDKNILELMNKQEWNALFLDHKEEWGKNIRALLFGHASMELCINPHIGLTGKSLLLHTEEDVLQLPEKQLQAWVDSKIADLIDSDALSKPANLCPLPLLGIPGAHPQQDKEFYQRTEYFRPWRGKYATIFSI